MDKKQNKKLIFRDTIIILRGFLKLLVFSNNIVSVISTGKNKRKSFCLNVEEKKKNVIVTTRKNERKEKKNYEKKKKLKL